MIRVRFFASLREALGCAELEVPWRAGLTLPGDVIDAVVAGADPERSEEIRKLLTAEQVIWARNQRVCKHPVVLEEGDEVAFYPPVTGG